MLIVPTKANTDRISPNTFSKNTQTHIKNKHESEVKWFKCVQCKFRGKSKRRLRGHVLDKHGGAASVELKCVQCPYKTTDNVDLAGHMRKNTRQTMLASHFSAPIVNLRRNIKLGWVGTCTVTVNTRLSTRLTGWNVNSVPTKPNQKYSWRCTLLINTQRPKKSGEAMFANRSNKKRC